MTSSSTMTHIMTHSVNRPPNPMNQPAVFTIFIIQLKTLGSRNLEITIPLKYDHNTTLTEIYMNNRMSRTPEAQEHLNQLQRMSQILQNFNQVAQRQGQQCSLFMAVQEIMNNFPVM
jgi:hypothetical protein